MKKYILIGGGVAILLILLTLSFFNKTKEKEEIIINENKNMDYIITLETNKGNIKFETYSNDAPNTVDNFINLAKKGFYNGIIFHRVIDGFMIQGGDPTGTGMGGPGYNFEDEIDANSKIYKEGYHKGIVAMANAGPNTQGSQFFIMVADYPLPPLYTIFGKVAEGQEVADEISLVEKSVNDKPLEDIVIKNVLIEEINN
jgi:cyclophilin family peptidyl-prolyl cis-trans isomerase